MLEKIFQVKKPIIGMIHLAGNSDEEKDARAIKELAIYESEGVDGAIIEDYHGTLEDVNRVLNKTKKGFHIVRGVNVLCNPYVGFLLAKRNGARFVQFDSVHAYHLSLRKYCTLRFNNPDITVLGGIRFKYQTLTGRSLQEDIDEGLARCDAIVTTGDGTGIETPIEKLRDFKGYMKNFPLVVGAGVNQDNVYEQLQVADAAIVGSCFKPNKDTQAEVSQELVKDFMRRVKEIRKSTA